MTEIGSPSAQAAGRVRYQLVILVGLTEETLQCRQLICCKPNPALAGTLFYGMSGATWKLNAYWLRVLRVS
jgi:hypothetical protein